MSFFRSSFCNACQLQSNEPKNGVKVVALPAACMPTRRGWLPAAPVRLASTAHRRTSATVPTTRSPGPARRATTACQARRCPTSTRARPAPSAVSARCGLPANAPAAAPGHIVSRPSADVRGSNAKALHQTQLWPNSVFTLLEQASPVLSPARGFIPLFPSITPHDSNKRTPIWRWFQIRRLKIHIFVLATPNLIDINSVTFLSSGEALQIFFWVFHPKPPNIFSP